MNKSLTLIEQNYSEHMNLKYSWAEYLNIQVVPRYMTVGE